MRAALAALALAACAEASPLVSETWTSEGTWRVASDAPLAPLRTDVVIAVVDGAGAPAPALDVTVTIAMPGMAHARGPLHLAETDPGTYAARVFLDMPGLYTLHGAVADDAGEERFRLVVEAR